MNMSKAVQYKKKWYELDEGMQKMWTNKMLCEKFNVSLNQEHGCQDIFYRYSTQWVPQLQSICDFLWLILYLFSYIVDYRTYCQ